MDPKDLLTPTELAAYLKCSTTTLKRWRRQGRGPSWIRVEGGVRYIFARVHDWLHYLPGYHPDAEGTPQS